MFWSNKKETVKEYGKGIVKVNTYNENGIKGTEIIDTKSNKYIFSLGNLNNPDYLQLATYSVYAYENASKYMYGNNIEATIIIDYKQVVWTDDNEPYIITYSITTDRKSVNSIIDAKLFTIIAYGNEDNSTREIVGITWVYQYDGGKDNESNG